PKSLHPRRPLPAPPYSPPRRSSDLTLTIAEPQPTVQFSAASETVDQSTGTFSVIVALSHASNQDVTVPYTLAGTAQSGTDYTGVGTSLHIPTPHTTHALIPTLLPHY